MTTHQIKFITGEKAGVCYKLNTNQSLAIGRSHSNDICLQALDVSGRHVMIRTGSGSSITVEVLSSRITKYNDQQVKLGDMIEVYAGDKVQLGLDTAFIFEVLPEDNTSSDASDDEDTVFPETNQSENDQKTSPAVSSVCNNAETLSDSATAQNLTQNDSTQLSATNHIPAEASESNSTETVAFQTRIASDDELDEIKKAFKRKYYKKVLKIALPIAIFFAAAISLYVYVKPATEEFLTWPQDEEGNGLYTFKQIAPYLALCYPEVPENQIKTAGSTVNIVTRIGKLQDVPLYISAESNTDIAHLKVDHQQAFDNWCEKMRDKDQSLNFGMDKTTLFLNTHRGAGVPISFLSYTRRKGNDDYWGYAAFIRKAGTEHTILFDVPFSAKWRAERFFLQNLSSMVIYASKRTAEHWEGTSAYRPDTTADQDLQEAETFMSREAPVYWGRIFYLLRSALIKASLNKNNEQIEHAQKMLVEMRDQQITWFNAQKLAYQYAERTSDKQSMRSIQAMCESVFSAEFQFADFRYDLIKRKDWK